MYQVILLAVLGAVFGSFLTAFTARLHDGRDWVKGRSECDSCAKELKPISLIPIVSWLVQRGSCRECGDSISWTYPLTEIITSAAFVLSYHFWPYSFVGFDLVKFVVWLAIFVGFLAMSIYDLRWMIIPNKIVYPLIGLVVLSVVVEAIFYGGGPELIRDSVLGLLAVGGLFYGLFQASKGRWIGGGDVKLGFAIGIVVAGFLKGILVVMLASFIGLLAALPVILMGRLKTNSQIPFGPSLMLAASVVYFFGDQFLDWYIGDLILL